MYKVCDQETFPNSAQKATTCRKITSCLKVSRVEINEKSEAGKCIKITPSNKEKNMLIAVEILKNGPPKKVATAICTYVARERAHFF